MPVRRIAALGKSGGTLEYVAAWFIKAGEYVNGGDVRIGFVATNSITAGEQVAQLWPVLFGRCKLEIALAHRTFATVVQHVLISMRLPEISDIMQSYNILYLQCTLDTFRNHRTLFDFDLLIFGSNSQPELRTIPTRHVCEWPPSPGSARSSENRSVKP